jgi:hypothetical protein
MTAAQFERFVLSEMEEAVRLVKGARISAQ